MERRNLVLLLAGIILLGIIMATNANYSIIVFPLFLIFLTVKDRVVPLFKNLPFPTFLLFLLIGLIVSFILEWGVGVDELKKNPSHSWLNNWLSLSIFYLLWLAGSYWIIKRFKLTPKGVFIVTSLFGILIEQQFQFFQILSSFNPAIIIFWVLYVPLAYTPVILIPYLILKNKTLNNG
ncbi:hypothetical protein HYU92_05410 [Candidatus Curtissbacteria bacterium]|nr:hypothetical protein [Candidatus Curtissbacteria bacterium]